MRWKNIFAGLLLIVFLGGLLFPAVSSRAAMPQSNLARSSSVSPDDLISAMNALRVANGLPALIENPIIDAVAQSTAEYMAAKELSWHIGNVRGRLAAAGYGAGDTVWATENFAYGYMGIDEIMVVWSDPDHMIPATGAAYCHVGAGVALAPNGMYYYVLQAAYTSEHACGKYNYPDTTGTTPQSGTTTTSNLIYPVTLATPDADGKIYHVVAYGQSLWSIAVAYKITVHDLEVWNNISRDTAIWVGQRLFIPSSNTEGYFTPTPVGMVVASTPDADGKIIHSVQAYQTLSTIADAYKVTLDTILKLNGLQADWPLQIGQKLLISPGWVTPSPTPRPLSPLEQLTPASDGRYYHIVQSGETLSWIASLYNVSLAELMIWNGLNSASIIQPNQKLVLQVTPPPTQTYTPRPPTNTAMVTPSPLPKTATRTPTQNALSPTATTTPVPPSGSAKVIWPVLLVIVVAGLIVSGLIIRMRNMARLTDKEEDPENQSSQ